MLVKPEPLADDHTDEQRKQFKENSDQFRKANSYAKSDLILKDENYDNLVTVKAWNIHSQLLDTVQHGQLITLYSVAVSKYDEIKDITITSGTSVEVTDNNCTHRPQVVDLLNFHSVSSVNGTCKLRVRSDKVGHQAERDS